MILILPLIYLFVCWIAGNVWFEWEHFLICIVIGAIWDIVCAIFGGD